MSELTHLMRVRGIQDGFNRGWFHREDLRRMEVPIPATRESAAIRARRLARYQLAVWHRFSIRRWYQLELGRSKRAGRIRGGNAASTLHRVRALANALNWRGRGWLYQLLWRLGDLIRRAQWKLRPDAESIPTSKILLAGKIGPESQVHVPSHPKSCQERSKSREQ